MRISTMLAGVAIAGLMALPVLAQDAAPGATQSGQYGEPLGRMLAEAADGTCLEALMAPSLLDACNGQIVGMSQGLKSLGAVESMTFVRAEATPAGGRVETWSVKFTAGPTLVWVIGDRQADGKFVSVGTARQTAGGGA